MLASSTGQAGGRLRALLSWEEIRTVPTTCSDLAGETEAETM